MKDSNESIVGSISFTDIIERKLAFHKNNGIFPREDNEERFRGELVALERMLNDSRSLSTEQFEKKYLAELASLKTRFEEKTYVPADDDYYEAYNNAVVSVLKLVDPVHEYDLKE